MPDSAPASWREHHFPQRTPGGHRLRPGPTVNTVQAALALVAVGGAIAIADTQASRYYTRPDITYLPITDGQPSQYAIIWRTTPRTPASASSPTPCSAKSGGGQEPDTGP